MGIKRNIVTEIVQRRDRSESRNYFGYSNKLDEINKVLEIETENEEFLKYIPVASIATLETFTRMIIKVIVDNGEPYLSNAIKLMREQFSFDIEYLIDLNGKRVSIGEIFSHQIKINKFSDLAAIFDKLLGIKFSDVLKKTNYDELALSKKDAKHFKKNFNDYICCIESLFKIRHIIAHEFAFDVNINKNEITIWLKNLKVFMDATSFIVEKQTGKYVPYTQMGMNKYASIKYEKSMKELKLIIKRIVSKNTRGRHKGFMENDSFMVSIEKWELYIEEFAKIFSNQMLGGSAYGFIHLTEKERLVRQMIDNINESFNMYLK
jgi:hypothetical protein